VTDERAAVLADDHAVIRLFDHGALPVVLGALLPLLAHRFELLRPALITDSGRPRRAGLRLPRPRILRPDRNAGRRRARGILALAALRRARRLASRLLGRLRPSRRAGRLARLLRRSRLAGAGLHSRSLAGLLRGSRLTGTGLRARSLAGLLRGSRLGGAAWLRSRRLAPLLLNWLALCTRRRGRLLGRARLTGLRPAGRRTAFLPFLLLGTLRLALRAGRAAILLRVLPLIASGALRRLSALGPGTLRLDLRLRAFGRSRLLLLAPLLPGLLRFGLCQQLGRRNRRRDLRRERAAAQRQRGDHDRARQQRAFLGNQVHVPASEIWVRPALATQSCSDCGNPCGTNSRAGVASRAHPRLMDKGPAIVARPRPSRGIARLSTSVPEPKRRDMSYQEIRYETGARIATITLDRPARLNAWTPNMGGEVRDAMRRAADDDAVRVIVLTGAGRGFCAGADMATLSRLTEARGSSATSQAPPPFDPESRPDFQKRYSYFPAVPKPIIAAVNGPCAGLGLVLALYCDLRFAAPEAQFTTAFSRRGLIAEHGISWTLPNLVGLSAALDLLLSARRVGAEEALRLRLVDRVTPPGELMDQVRAYASELAEAVSPRSMRVMKRQLWEARFQSLAEAIDTADRAMAASFASEDFREGVAHYVEKRKPAFTGR